MLDYDEKPILDYRTNQVPTCPERQFSWPMGCLLLMLMGIMISLLGLAGQFVFFAMRFVR